MNLGGIRTAEDLKSRCKIDPYDEHSCWIWRHAVDERGLPKLHFAGSTMTIANVMARLKTGAAPVRGAVWFAQCLERRCCNPAHFAQGTHSAATKRGRKANGLLHQTKLTAARRARAKLTEQQADEIRTSTESPALIAARYGIGKSQVHRIRRGTNWRPLPTSASSVFAWRP